MNARIRNRLIVPALAWSVLGCSPVLNTNVTTPDLRFRSDSSATQMVTTLVGDKNVFIPATIVVASGAPHTLSIYNTTDAPHGFRIPGLGIETLLMPKEENRVELPAMEGGRIFRIDCHLHMPHRGATLVVVPAD
jgi:heme/copper-type cytochrome/quinol oxidase subunit 2